MVGAAVGPIYTLDMLRVNSDKHGGGTDVTDDVLLKLREKYGEGESEILSKKIFQLTISKLNYSFIFKPVEFDGFKIYSKITFFRVTCDVNVDTWLDNPAIAFH